MSEDTAVKQKGDFKSKRNIILIILIAIIIVFVGILNYFTSKNLYNGKIAQNIYIEDVNVSNMTKQEALETIDAKYPTKKVNLSYNNEYYTIEPNQVVFSVLFLLLLNLKFHKVLLHLQLSFYHEVLQL